MPEGPECAVVSDAINQHCPATFSTVEVVENVAGKKHRFSRTPPCNWEQLKQPWRLNYTCTRGKLIIFEIDILETNKRWVGFSTLGMSGDWVWDGRPEKHCRLNFVGDRNSDLSFVDMRCFGTFRLTSLRDAKLILKKIGWNLVKAPMPEKRWKKLQWHRKITNKTIGEILLDQSLFSGIGNIYKAETLYSVGVHPSKKVKELSQLDWLAINQVAHKIMERAYQAKGCSVVDFTANGQEGKAQHYLKIYGKTRCPRNHRVSTLKQGKGSNSRTTWYCETCQPIRSQR